MGIEIERKFLVIDDRWRSEIRRSRAMEQGYLSNEIALAVRVRVVGDQALLTIKGAARGLTRSEFEYEIPIEDARQMLDQFCGDRRIVKVRHEVKVGDHLWEIDVFDGNNRGLVVAEVELEGEQEEVEIPDWVGQEVTGDPRFLNARLVEEPYLSWEGDR